MAATQGMICLVDAVFIFYSLCRALLCFFLRFCLGCLTQQGLLVSAFSEKLLHQTLSCSFSVSVVLGSVGFLSLSYVCLSVKKFEFCTLEFYKMKQQTSSCQ